MLNIIRRNLAVFLAAVLGVVVGSVGPSVARAAYDAVNADKVDGKHAVGSNATASQRAGKLVAANSNGRAPDSERLRGYTHAKLRVQPLPIQGAHVGDGATKFSSGISLPAAGISTFTIGFVVPPDHAVNGKLYVDLVFAESTVAACNWYVFADGLVGPNPPNGQFNNGGWRALPNSNYDGPVSAPVGSDGHTQVFEWPFENQPGQVVQFELTRAGDNAADTCGAVTVYGLQLRY